MVRSAEPLRLIVQITVDQLRGDMLPRYRERLGPAGFRRLLDHGVTFTQARHGTGNTFTASGHAVLVTGADTAGHGMVANEWFDRDRHAVTYCTSDPRHPTLGEPPRPGGLSPVQLLSTTVGDELVAGTGGRSRSFAVAGKDRSAIIPGGHRGRAFWFSESTGDFVSSTYYFPQTLPDWTRAWNERKAIARFRALTWEPLRDLSSYEHAAAAANPHARPKGSLGRTFPHPLLAQSEALFLAAFRYTPFLDELTADFARELLVRERLGKNDTADYLAISFSATDYIGHIYGPSSVEYEDNLLRLDATLATLLAAIDREVGLDRTLVVLSSDHGVDDIPEARRAAGRPAGRIHPARVREAANAMLRERLGVSGDLVEAFVPPGFYLDRAHMKALDLPSARVASDLAAVLRGVPGVAHAFTQAQVLDGDLPAGELAEKIKRSFHPGRSGDVVIVPEPFWYLYPDPEIFAAMHGSPYSYDTFVPMVFCGPGLRARSVERPAEPAGIAPTLARWMGVADPSGCRADVLPEALPSVRGAP